jgi:hypothetical protein
MASGSVFSETLQTITTTKLEELDKQRSAFDKEYAALLTAAKAEQDPLKRLTLLVGGTKSCLGLKPISGKSGSVTHGGTRNSRLETDLKNLDRFLEQALFDPSVSRKVLEGWEKTLLQYLSVQASNFQYADLYGKLVTEWLSSEKTQPTDDDVEMMDSFEKIPGAKKLASRATWEKNVFEPASVDIQALKVYLEQLFITDKKAATSAITDLRKQVENFENSISAAQQFNIPTLRWVIEGLEKSDLLPNEKREVLKDFLSNDVILAEIGDVLSMRIAALERWTWGEHVPLEQRRKLNGSFSIHMHEDVLQAIFLHYVGVKWSVFFKGALKHLRKQSVWKRNRAEIPKIDRKRRGYFLGDLGTQTSHTLELTRDRAHRKEYFAHQLLDFETQQTEVQEGEEEAEYGDHVEPTKKRRHGGHQPMQQMQQMPVQSFSLNSSSRAKAAHYLPAESMTYVKDLDCDEGEYEEEEDEVRVSKRPMEAKQGLLHLLSTEIVVNTRLHGELSCFRTVFESWNPLLPHQTVLVILEFFGVSGRWRNFFTKFLQAPLKFMEDGHSADARIRRRGTPGSHTLSDFLGEAVLFCLDFAVNQATDGALLYRLYDDLWFWNKDYEQCVKAWGTVTDFAKVMGVEVSMLVRGWKETYANDWHS